jgi:hypothetical protein
MKTHLSLLLGLLACAFLVVGCPAPDEDDDDDLDDDDDTESFSVVGSWIDGWGSTHVISETSWVSGSLPAESTHALSEFDAAAHFAVGQNGPDNAWGADLWSRFDWARVDEQLWYCQTAFAEESEVAALAVEAPDATDPATTGCGGYPWSSLSWHPGPLAVIGQYNDGWGTFHAVLPDAWHIGSLSPSGSVFTFTRYDNDEGWAIAQNHADNAWSPGLWSRFDWTVSGGGLWFCQTAYEAADEDAAEATPAADATDPATSGCGGFGWTNLGEDQGVISLAGGYTDQWDTDHLVGWDAWIQGDSEYHLIQWNSAEGWAVAHNGADNAFNPGLFSRFDWVEDAGSLWYCQTAYAAADETTALETPAADPTDPAASGCEGFGWTNLTP